MTYQKKSTGPFSMTEELRSALQIWGRATEGDEDADDVVTEALNRISQPVAAQRHAQAALSDKEIDLIMVTNGFPNTRPTAAFRSFARAILAANYPPAAAPSAPATEPMEDPVTVPRGLLGSACHAIVNKKGAPNTLEKLRSFILAKAPAAPSCFLCHGTGQYQIPTAVPAGIDQPAPMMAECQQCKAPAAPAIQVQEGPETDASVFVEDHPAFYKYNPNGLEGHGSRANLWEYGQLVGWRTGRLAAAPAPVQPAPAADSYQQGRAAGIKEAATVAERCYIKDPFKFELGIKAAVAIRALAAKPSEEA